MPAPFDFPGHYWDEHRQRFFKIEKTGTAPEGSQWSQDHVRVRVQHDTALQQRRDRRRQQRERRVRPVLAAGVDGMDVDMDDSGDNDPLTFPPRIVRPLFYENPLMGGFLSRETDHWDWGEPQIDPQRPQRLQRLQRPALAATATEAYVKSLCAQGWMPVLYDKVAQEAEEGMFDDNERHPHGALGQPLQTAWGRPRVLTRIPVRTMYVNGDDEKTGLGVLYSFGLRNSSNLDVKAQYIPRDARNFLVEDWPTEGPYARYARFSRMRTEGLGAAGATTINYHRPSHHMIITHRSPSRHQYGGIDGLSCIQLFSPHIEHDANDPGPAWRVGGAVTATGRLNSKVLRVFAADQNVQIFSCAPAPASASNLLCVVGTEDGIKQIDLQRLTAASAKARAQGTGDPSARRLEYRAGTDLFLNDYALSAPFDGIRQLRQQRARKKIKISKYEKRQQKNPRPLIVSVDFFEGHPSLVLAAGHSPYPWLVDLREPETRQWHSFGGYNDRWATNSKAQEEGGAGNGMSRCVARVRSVGQHRVVAAGVHDTMLLYDVRNLGTETASSPSSPRPLSNNNNSNTAGLTCNPLLRFQGYRNKETFNDFVFDVEPSLGLVATADDERVHMVNQPGRPFSTRRGRELALFSLATGRRLEPNSSLRLDKLCHPYDGPPLIMPGQTLESRHGSSGTPPETAQPLFVNALHFARLPGDKASSLFVASTYRVTKLSPGIFGEDGDPDNNDHE